MQPPPIEYLRTRQRFYSDHFGPLTEPIKHSVEVKEVHVDIYTFKPFAKRRHWTLITGGMSDNRQTPLRLVSEGTNVRTEIMMYTRAACPWMFSAMKGLAEMPFEMNTFLHWFHTVPNGQPMTSEISWLTNSFFVPPVFETKALEGLSIAGEKVDVLQLVPITDAELRYKLKNGAAALLRIFAEHAYDLVVDERRPSFV